VQIVIYGHAHSEPKARWRFSHTPPAPHGTRPERADDVAAALDWVRGFACTSEVLKRLDPAAAARAVGRLREALAAHMSDDGVWFNSRAWIVTACRR